MIYDNRAVSGQHLSFGTILFDNAENKLTKFFTQKRLSATFLRRRYPKVLHVFRSDNFKEIVLYGMTAYCNTLKDQATMIYPSESIVNASVADRKQRITIKRIVEVVLTEGANYIVRWQDWRIALNSLNNSGDDIDIVYCLNAVHTYCMNNYPFLETGLKQITSIVGEKVLRRMIGQLMNQNKIWIHFYGLQHLCFKIEGRKCAYSECSNQESRDGVIE